MWTASWGTDERLIRPADENVPPPGQRSDGGLFWAADSVSPALLPPLLAAQGELAGLLRLPFLPGAALFRLFALLPLGCQGLLGLCAARRQHQLPFDLALPAFGVGGLRRRGPALYGRTKLQAAMVLQQEGVYFIVLWLGTEDDLAGLPSPARFFCRKWDEYNMEC